MAGSESDWLAYVGVASGLVGAATGIAGAVMGYVSYRRTNNIKRLDLRVELRKRLADTHSLLDELPGLLDRALRSRRAVAAALGNFNSGRQRQWEEMLQIDQAVPAKLRQDLPERNSTFMDASEGELEKQLLQLHVTGAAAVALHEKYRSEIAADDKSRDHLREDQRALIASRSGNHT